MPDSFALPSPADLDFDADVLAASRERPVLVDFWAPWCGPCRVLGPTLDRLADGAEGRWTLVKVNADEAPDLMARYGVRGIPAVKLFVDGAVAAEFTGALPEHAVRQWLAEHLPSPGRARYEAGRQAFEAGDRDAARAELEAALDDDGAPWAGDARALLARALVFDDPDRARGLVQNLHTAEAKAVRTVADALARDAAGLPDGPGRDRTSSALAALQGGRLDAAVEAYLDVIRADRYYDDDGARKAVVALFQTLGEGHPVTKRHRPAFNMSLY
jgi:putative thioredoxin